MSAASIRIRKGHGWLELRGAKTVFLYGEFQISVPSSMEEMWKPVNRALKDVPCLVRNMWTVAIGTNTVGGCYEFDSVEHAHAFAEGLYAQQAAHLGSSLTEKLAEGNIAEAASRDLRSLHYS